MNPSLEIPIDPALLLEEEHHATDNDLEDAEGELVDQPMEDDYAQEEFDVIHVSVFGSIRYFLRFLLAVALYLRELGGFQVRPRN